MLRAPRATPTAISATPTSTAVTNRQRNDRRCQQAAAHSLWAESRRPGRRRGVDRHASTGWLGDDVYGGNGTAASEQEQQSAAPAASVVVVMEVVVAGVVVVVVVVARGRV